MFSFPTFEHWATGAALKTSCILTHKRGWVTICRLTDWKGWYCGFLLWYLVYWDHKLSKMNPNVKENFMTVKKDLFWKWVSNHIWMQYGYKYMKESNMERSSPVLHNNIYNFCTMFTWWWGLEAGACLGCSKPYFGRLPYDLLGNGFAFKCTTFNPLQTLWTFHTERRFKDCIKFWLCSAVPFNVSEKVTY